MLGLVDFGGRGPVHKVLDAQLGTGSGMKLGRVATGRVVRLTGVVGLVAGFLVWLPARIVGVDVCCRRLGALICTSRPCLTSWSSPV